MRINRYTVKLVKEGSLNYPLEDVVARPEIARNVIEKVFNLSSSPVEKFGIIALTTKNKIAGIHMNDYLKIALRLQRPQEIEGCNGIVG
ncbi:MAG: hypothetical protein ACYDEJ_04670 [Desulfitobacteriaceae bacterium]